MDILGFLKKLPIDNVTQVKKISYPIPQSATQVLCGTVDDKVYAAYVTPHGSRFVWIEREGNFKLNTL